MMASFLLVIIRKKTNKEKNAFYYSVSQIHINPEKNMKKNQNDFSRCTYSLSDGGGWSKMKGSFSVSSRSILKAISHKIL